MLQVMLVLVLVRNYMMSRWKLTANATPGSLT